VRKGVEVSLRVSPLVEGEKGSLSFTKKTERCYSVSKVFQ
jgi:hypothetical protein